MRDLSLFIICNKHAFRRFRINPYLNSPCKLHNQFNIKLNMCQYISDKIYGGNVNEILFRT